MNRSRLNFSLAAVVLVALTFALATCATMPRKEAQIDVVVLGGRYDPHDNPRGYILILDRSTGRIWAYNESALRGHRDPTLVGTMTKPGARVEPPSDQR